MTDYGVSKADYIAGLKAELELTPDDRKPEVQAELDRVSKEK
jgi:hypothetical protein